MLAFEFILYPNSYVITFPFAFNLMLVILSVSFLFFFYSVQLNCLNFNCLLKNVDLFKTKWEVRSSLMNKHPIEVFPLKCEQYEE